MTDRWLRWGLLALGCVAAVCTAHGLYEVARTSGQPAFIAGLYPAVTDGLAVMAYALTRRLQDRTRLYAAATVLLAGGLSALAQAMQLVNGLNVQPPATVRFAIGAWPVVAVLLAGHLWWLATVRQDRTPATVQPEAPTVRDAPVAVVAAPRARAGKSLDAWNAGMAVIAEHHRLPTVTEIQKAAGVSRGIAQKTRHELAADSNAALAIGSTHMQNGHART